MEIKSRNDFGKLLEHFDLLRYPACEVGVAEGRYSRDILSYGVPLLYLVDLWRHVDGRVAELGAWTNKEHDEKLRTCVENLAGYEPQYEILQGWSTEMANQIPDNTLGFVYIDATHTYDEVLRDLRSYWPKLVHGGVLAGHDYLSRVWPQVQEAVKHFAYEQGAQVHTVPENNVNDASFWMRKV